MLSSVNIDAICVSCQSSSVYFSWALDKNYCRSSIAYHLFVNSATFFSGMRLFPKWWRWTWLRWSSWWWLTVLVCLCGPSSLPWNLVFCSLSPLQSLKIPVVVSPQRTTCIHLGAASRLSLVSASFRNSFKTESSVHNSALLQFRYPTLGPKLYHEYLFESFTDQLLRQARWQQMIFIRPFLRPCVCSYIQLFLLVSMVYVLCDPINLSYLLHCCLSLSLELLSKGGCAQS